MNKLLSVALLFALTLIISCGKDDPQPSKTSLISTHAWAVTKVEVQVGTTPAVDATSDFIEACDTDDRYTFAASGAVTYSVGADDCDGSAEDQTGTWKFATNETQFSLTTDGDTQLFRIVTLSSTTFKISADQTGDVDGDGKDETYSLIFTFTAK